jgi:hypothetical protein
VLVIGPDATITVNWNRAGRVQDRVVDASFGADLKGPLSAGCRHIAAFELVQEREFHRDKTDCGMNTAWLRWLELSADYGWGTGVNYFPGPEVAPFLARARSATLSMTLRPGPRIGLAQTYLHTHLETRRERPPAPGPAGIVIFDNHIWRSKLTYQFTRELSLRVILDYNAVLPNASLVDLERAKRLTGDVLLTYLLNPWTAAYVGYTDNYENLRLTPPPTALQRTGPPDVPTGRQVYVKTSYVLRF